MAPPPGRGFIPPTMPPMFSGGFKHLWGRFSFCGFRCSSDHPSVPTPESTKGSNIRPIRPTKPPWVCRCAGSSCGERGDFGFLNQTTFYQETETFLSETCPSPTWSTQPRPDQYQPNCEETTPAKVFPQGIKKSAREQWIYERPGSLHLQLCITSNWSIKTREKWSKDSGLGIIWS